MRLLNRHILVGLFIPMLAGCPSAEFQVETTETSATLDCEVDGYPCSLDKVASDVLRRGADLSDQVLAMLDDGASIDQAIDFIKVQPDVAETMSSRVGLNFRLNGGRDVTILLSEALAPTASSSPKNKAAKTIRPAQHVVGNDPRTKRALVLSPFRYDFQEDDEGEAVAEILQGARGYSGNVNYLENATKSAKTVGYQQFIGWEDYDVIHISSHGASFCNETRCISVILTGDAFSNVEDLFNIPEPGIGMTRRHGSKDFFLSLRRDFFISHYPGGLDRKIIFFNACQTFVQAGSNFGDVLVGAASVYFGWSETVEADAATKAAIALFTDLADNGVTAQAAMDNLGDLGINKFIEKGHQVASFLLIDRNGVQDARAREVVTLEHPARGGELVMSADVEAVGTAEDGIPDLVPYQVLIEGIPENQQDAVVMQFFVEGHASYPQAVTIGERVGATGWRLSGQIPYDDVAPQQTVEMIARVQLPEGGISEHRVIVNLTGKPELAPETWVGQAVSHFDDSVGGQIHVTVTADVTFKQTPSTINGPFKRLEVTGGTLHWSRSGTIKTLQDGECPYSTGPIDVPILAGDGEILIDTRVTPNTYTLSGSTQGSEIRLAENCGNYAFSTRAGGSWAPALGSSDGAQVSSDGGTISGTTADNTQTWEWIFTRQ